MASNLPPGVSESMIPGNRPEDDAEERFWAQLYERLGSISRDEQEILDRDIAMRAIELARELGYELGVAEGRADEQLAQAAREQEASEREPGWPGWPE